jgi:hypothetical protein
MKKIFRVYSRYAQHLRVVHIVTVRMTAPKYQDALAKKLIYFSPLCITMEEEGKKQSAYSVI